MNLVNKLYDFDITKYYQLYNIAIIMKMKGDNLEIFIEKVHTKGINLIKDKKMNVEEIIAFIQLNQYYCNPHFKEKGKNDPVIMEYIQITDVDPNYLKNIELIKKNNLIDIFIDSKVENEFYSIILKQIRKIKDFNIIFMIFPLKKINKRFTFLINSKMEKLIFTILDIKREKYADIFNIFNNWIAINSNNYLDLNYVFDKIFLNFDIPYRYFLYQLKNKTQYSEKIINNMKNKIITMFCLNLEQHDFNLLMDLLINSDDKLCLYFLENMKDLYFDKDDFYKKRKNSKILLFETFNDKCKNLFTKFGNSKGTYTFKVKKIKDSILFDLQNSDINFSLLKSIITEDEDFENKLKRITSNDKEAIDLFNKLKDNYNQFQKDFNDIEIILGYYTTFYPNSKGELIELIKIKQKEYKEDKMINELINMDIKNFYNIKNFYLKEAIEEAVNIKYKYSLFFYDFI